MSRPQKRRFQNNDEKKEKYNSTISSSIADIIRFSLDDQFRSKCFQLMQVDNTNDFQLAIKQKLDLLTTPCSSTSPSLQKRPSFHDDEAERIITCPERNEMIPQVDVERQADENIEVLNPLSQNITDSHIDEIAKVLKMTNIVMGENIEEKYKQPGTSGSTSKTFIEAEKIKKDITPNNVKCNEEESRENMDGFWPTEECCLWDSYNIQESNEAELLLQEEIDDIDLNENDTDWQ